MKKINFPSLLRNKTFYIIISLSVFVLVVGYSLTGIVNEPKVDFNAEIRPILNKNCIVCHGGVKKSGGFGLLFRQDALEATESGKPAIIPGNPEESEMIKRLRNSNPEFRMPLNHPPLTEKEIVLLVRWIKQGANWEDHWAYIPPKPVEIPDVSDKWIMNDIDKFIFAKLDEMDMEPSPEADKQTLLRRLSLDLTGLPPTLEEVEKFVNDKSPSAYEKEVDRLLSSPHYGERWASMWLDLARYADSKGYEKDQPRLIYKYRDWVISSFNRDKPYDQFTVEQLAGDLLPNPSDDQILATAFHRNTMNNDEGGTDDEEFRVAAVIDRVNTTWDVWTGTTMGCVQCHSHPYDPIRHKEYYQFLSFFNNTEDADKVNEAPLMTLFDKEEENQLENMIQWITQNDKTIIVDKKTSNSNRAKQATFPILMAGDCDEFKGLELKPNKIAGYITSGSYIRFNKLNLKDVESITYSYASAGGGGYVEVHAGSLNGRVISRGLLRKTGGWEIFKSATIPVQQSKDKMDLYFVFIENKAMGGGLFDMQSMLLNRKMKSKLDQEVLDKKKLLIEMLPPPTPVMQDLPYEKRRKTHVFIRGNWMVKGDTVESDVPRAFGKLAKGAPRNRLGMAQWLVSTQHPLTARVAVNRFWEQLFGYGIVETLEDFGSQGMKPSHQELLDYLALKFMKEYKWSNKKLLKEIVMSATYRQSSRVSKEHLEKDPRNKYLARAPRLRLSSEQVRDEALAVSGLLSKKMYGPSVMPYQPEGIWQVVYNEFDSYTGWKVSEGEDKHRRALYTFWRRTSPYPSMVTFDSPSREFCVSRRIRTNTPLQALVTLNDTVYIEAARALASRMMSEKNSALENRIEKGYQLALSKKPSPATLQKLLELYRNAVNYYKEKPQAAFLMTALDKDNKEFASFTVVANAIMNLDEFITKE